MLNKDSWGEGPWQTEPDRLEWRRHGMPCLIVRAEATGALCGYVGLPPGHPLHGRGSDDVEVTVHGGLTFASGCIEGSDICHTPEPGEPEHVWWFGFDAAHAFDLVPAIRALLVRIKIEQGVSLPVPPHWPREVYRSLDYVRGEVERLADQLHELGEEAVRK